MQDQPQSRRPYRGRGPSVRRLRFFELLDAGMRPLEASRQVGVNERTGRDWAKGIVKNKNRRYTFDGVLVWEAPGRPKAPREEKVISARFLSVEERIEIADLHRQGVSVRQIAGQLSRAPSTISRELRRNAHPGSGDYRPWAAQRRAARRRARPKPGKITQCPRLREAVAAGLRRRWSPEQISKRLRLQFPEQPEMHVTHETIYQALYVQGRGELRRELAKCLRTGRAVRRPQRRPDERRSRFQSPMLMISERPAEAADRAVPGHWEGDLVLGARHQSGEIANPGPLEFSGQPVPADLFNRPPIGPSVFTPGPSRPRRTPFAISDSEALRSRSLASRASRVGSGIRPVVLRSSAPAHPQWHVQEGQTVRIGCTTYRDNDPLHRLARGAGIRQRRRNSHAR